MAINYENTLVATGSCDKVCVVQATENHYGGASSKILGGGRGGEEGGGGREGGRGREGGGEGGGGGGLDGKPFLFGVWFAIGCLWALSNY